MFGIPKGDYYSPISPSQMFGSSESSLEKIQRFEKAYYKWGIITCIALAVICTSVWGVRESLPYLEFK